jgi:hypothetical protein
MKHVFHPTCSLAHTQTLYDIWADACLLVLGLASPGNLYSIASAMARASYFHLPLLNGVATVSLVSQVEWVVVSRCFCFTDSS